MEENSLLVFNYIFNSNSESHWEKDIVYTLNYLYNTNVFKTENPKNLQPWIIKINSLIRNGNINEKIGAFKLSELITENSEVLFAKNCGLWINGIAPLLNKPEYEHHRTTLIDILLKYLQKSKELQVERLSVSLNNQVTKILQVIILMMEKDPKNMINFAVLQKRCMDLFPFSINSLKNKIETILLSYLQGNYGLEERITKNVIELLISYNVALSKVEKTNTIDNFISKLLGTLHETLDMLLDSVEEENKINVSFPSFALSKNFDSQWIKNEQLINRYNIYTYTLSRCLCQYNNKIIKSVSIDNLLDVLCRVINVFEGSIQKENVKKENFDLLINSMPLLIQRSIVYLDSLIFCFNKSLLPHKELLYEIMHKLIHRASRNYTLSISLYRIMESYINLFELSFFNEFKEKIFTLILKDIHLLNKLDEKTSIIVENKPKKRKLEKGLTASSDIKINDIEKLIALLQFLKAISIYRKAFKLDASLDIDECIIKFLLEQFQKTFERTEKFNTLILECFNCLVNSVIYSSDSTSPCLSYAIRVFSLGLNDFSVKIREVCKDALIKCNSLIHPYLPSIYKSSSIQKTIKKAVESREKENIISSYENNVNTFNNVNNNEMEMDMDEDFTEEKLNDDRTSNKQKELNKELSEMEEIEEPEKTEEIKLANVNTNNNKKAEEEHFIVKQPEISPPVKKMKEDVQEVIENVSENQVEKLEKEKSNETLASPKKVQNIYKEEEEHSDSDIELPDIVVDSDEE
ncbi:hypothetical protein BCR36DRAFT_330403 [Piromyces finnis]|uniref:Pre-rRNA-processing protein RIX1 n=1 Tax=Piromyces finnis TaxID=1754191 RepID=A0A1Y1V5A8_9FUNG|nr:hypothetical protein BCR36DRAFT_330403 [Piromyces finnis]|eukprot:ORX47612.1 hypothetical protein BCR36DRAFT_330403 [Piromyces finnis]